MSNNLYGELYYGFPIDRDKDKYFKTDFEYKDKYKWLEDPMDWNYFFDKDYFDEGNIISEVDMSNYYNVDIDISGSLYGGDPIYYIYIKESKKSSYYGEMVKIEELVAKPEWKVQLNDFCELLSIDKEEPSWYLTSLEG